MSILYIVLILLFFIFLILCLAPKCDFCNKKAIISVFGKNKIFHIGCQVPHADLDRFYKRIRKENWYIDRFEKNACSNLLSGLGFVCWLFPVKSKLTKIKKTKSRIYY